MTDAEIGKMIPVLHYSKDGAHLVVMNNVGDVKIAKKLAEDTAEHFEIIKVLGFDTVIISDFVLLPMDHEICKQIICTYIGVIGASGVYYCPENELLSELEK